MAKRKKLQCSVLTFKLFDADKVDRADDDLHSLANRSRHYSATFSQRVIEARLERQ